MELNGEVTMLRPVPEVVMTAASAAVLDPFGKATGGLVEPSKDPNWK
jgi:hypothetical protein